MQKFSLLAQKLTILQAVKFLNPARIRMVHSYWPKLTGRVCCAQSNVWSLNVLQHLELWLCIVSMPIWRFYNQEPSSTSSVRDFHPNYPNFHITYSLWVQWSFSENMIFIENYNLLMKSRLEVEHKVVKKSNDLSCLHVFYDHDLLQCILWSWIR